MGDRVPEDRVHQYQVRVGRIRRVRVRAGKVNAPVQMVKERDPSPRASPVIKLSAPVVSSGPRGPASGSQACGTATRGDATVTDAATVTTTLTVSTQLAVLLVSTPFLS